MNRYYHELKKLVYDDFGISPSYKFCYRTLYFTTDDYLIWVSMKDPLKNIFSLFKTYKTKQEVLEFIQAASEHLIQATMKKHPDYVHYYGKRIKELTLWEYLAHPSIHSNNQFLP